MLLGSLLLMAMLSALVKTVSPRQPLPEIMFYRFAGSLAPLAWVLSRAGGISALRTAQPLQHALRSTFGIFGIGLYFYALGAIPIADATALTYSAPLFLVLFAITFLGERVGVRSWVALMMGFTGMLLIANPGGHGFGLGTIAAVGSAIFGALVSVWIRRLSLSDAPVTIALFYNTSGAVVALAWLLLSGKAPGFDVDTLFMFAIGLIAGVQQFLMTSSFRYAEASFLAPLEYVALVFAGFAGWLFFSEVPSVQAVVGAVVVSLSGVLIVRGRGRRA